MSILKMKRGFTLIELMIVVAIIGILAAIAIPKFSQLIVKGNEANTKGNLGAIRSALSIYYGDTEGYYPTDNLASLITGAKYMNTVPVAKLPQVTALNTGHADSANVLTTGAALAVTDAGGWVYDENPALATWGSLITNCSHKDTRSTLWTSY